MTGFSAEWLALREPFDHRARNAQLREAVTAHFAQRDQIAIVDLACGAGSNLRGLAPYLPLRQTWRLVDHDPCLLAAAKDALIAWADALECSDPLILLKGDRRVEVVFAGIDLVAAPGSVLDYGADLVTSAAFFDLVSSAWIRAFCAELARRKQPLYAILTYSGEEVWLPPHPDDVTILSAFHQHQGRDKGFGPAAGPRGALLLREALEAQGYRVAAEPSPWRLTAADYLLVEALADGIAAAAAETGSAPAAMVANWRDARRRATGCEIGHSDLFAIP